MYHITYDENTWLNLTGQQVIFIKDDIDINKIYYYDSTDVEYTPIAMNLVTNDNIYWVKTIKSGTLKINNTADEKEDKPPIVNNRTISRNHFYIIAADKKDIPYLVNKLNSATIIDYKHLPTNPNSLVSYLKKY